MRPSGRDNDVLRPIQFIANYTKHAEGAVLVEFGHTKVICTASVCEGIPRFLKNQGKGWLTAEYAMLPRATHTRGQREHHKPSGRTQEIQRLIGRALRAAVDLTKLKDYTIHIDCDVIQADGGTRTAAISGGAVALAHAVRHMLINKLIPENPLQHLISAVSVGMHQGEAILDLDYAEDMSAETDMNLVMDENACFVEIQGTAEGKAFSDDALQKILMIGKVGIQQIQSLQKQAIGLEINDTQ